MKQNSTILFLLMSILNYGCMEQSSNSAHQEKKYLEIKLAIPYQFSYAGSFSGGMAPVCKIINEQRKCGYIDRTGKVIIEYQYDKVGYFSEGLAPVLFGNKWGYIDEKNKLKIKPQFDEAHSFSGGYARVTSSMPDWDLDEGYEKCKFINKNGDYVLDMPIYGCKSFTEGLAVAGFLTENREIKFGLIDTNGSKITRNLYDSLDIFSEGLIAAQKKIGSKWGYVNKHGEEVIPFQFDSASDFVDGLAVVFIGKRCGYINQSGDFVINPIFEECTSFSGGYATVNMTSIKGGHNIDVVKKNYILIDKQGNKYPNKIDQEILIDSDPFPAWGKSAAGNYAYGYLSIHESK